MSELYERSRRAEDEYFRRKDAELIERARQSRPTPPPRDRTSALEQRMLGDALGIHDADVIAPLHAAGLRASSAVLVEWLPAIEVAWIDDVDIEEREELRRQFAVDSRTSSGGLALLTEWLFVRPPHEAMIAARRALRRRLEAMDATSRTEALRGIVSRCEAIGRASGGVFGLGAVSWDEQARIDTIREELGDQPRVPDGPIEIAH